MIKWEMSSQWTRATGKEIWWKTLGKQYNIDAIPLPSGMWHSMVLWCIIIIMQ